MRLALVALPTGPSDSGLAASSLFSSDALVAGTIVELLLGVASAAFSSDFAVLSVLDVLSVAFAFFDSADSFEAAGESDSDDACVSPALEVEAFSSEAFAESVFEESAAGACAFGDGFPLLSLMSGPLGSTVGPLRARMDATSGNPRLWLARH